MKVKVMADEGELFQSPKGRLQTCLAMRFISRTTACFNPQRGGYKLDFSQTAIITAKLFQSPKGRLQTNVPCFFLILKNVSIPKGEATNIVEGKIFELVNVNIKMNKKSKIKMYKK